MDERLEGFDFIEEGGLDFILNKLFINHCKQLLDSDGKSYHSVRLLFFIIINFSLEKNKENHWNVKENVIGMISKNVDLLIDIVMDILMTISLRPSSRYLESELGYSEEIVRYSLSFLEALLFMHDTNENNEGSHSLKSFLLHPNFQRWCQIICVLSDNDVIRKGGIDTLTRIVILMSNIINFDSGDNSDMFINFSSNYIQILNLIAEDNYKVLNSHFLNYFELLNTVVKILLKNYNCNNESELNQKISYILDNLMEKITTIMMKTKSVLIENDNQVIQK
jgi:hypothetical protein